MGITVSLAVGDSALRGQGLLASEAGVAEHARSKGVFWHKSLMKKLSEPARLVVVRGDRHSSKEGVVALRDLEQVFLEKGSGADRKYRFEVRQRDFDAGGLDSKGPVQRRAFDGKRMWFKFGYSLNASEEPEKDEDDNYKVNRAYAEFDPFILPTADLRSVSSTVGVSASKHYDWFAKAEIGSVKYKDRFVEVEYIHPQKFSKCRVTFDRDRDYCVVKTLWFAAPPTKDGKQTSKEDPPFFPTVQSVTAWEEKEVMDGKKVLLPVHVQMRNVRLASFGADDVWGFTVEWQFFNTVPDYLFSEDSMNGESPLLEQIVELGEIEQIVND
jgi:hypothetical protein